MNLKTGLAVILLISCSNISYLSVWSEEYKSCAQDELISVQFSDNLNEDESVGFSSLQPVNENDGIVFRLNSITEEKESVSLWNLKKHPFVGLGGMMAFNVILSVWNRYMIGSNWAQTDFSDWNRFWERKLEFDTDWYWTNFVLHPYQGSLYYMAARGANLNSLESLGITFLGSFIWEYFGEKNDPSINDMVYTTIASFGVGEMLYRLSMEANSFSRLFGILVNPQRLWTEYLWRIHPPQTVGNIFEMSGSVMIGMTHTYTNILGPGFDYNKIEIYPFWFMPEFHVVYNDPYTHESNVPYSQFNLSISAALGKGSGMGSDCNWPDIDKALFYWVRIFSDGMLFARTLDTGQNSDTSIGLVLEYDFDWHSFYQFSSIAPGVAVKQRIRLGDSKIEWQAHCAGVVLGTSDFYYYRRQLVDKGAGTARTYSYNIGFENLLRFKYEQPGRQAFGIDFHGYALYDFQSQVQSFSCTGWEFIGICDIAYEFYFTDYIRFGVADNIYIKYAIYESFPDIFQLVNSPKVFVKIQI